MGEPAACCCSGLARVLVSSSLSPTCALAAPPPASLAPPCTGAFRLLTSTQRQPTAAGRGGSLTGKRSHTDIRHRSHPAAPPLPGPRRLRRRSPPTARCCSRSRSPVLLSLSCDHERQQRRAAEQEAGGSDTDARKRQLASDDDTHERRGGMQRMMLTLASPVVRRCAHPAFSLLSPCLSPRFRLPAAAFESLAALVDPPLGDRHFPLDRRDLHPHRHHHCRLLQSRQRSGSQV